MNYFKELWNKFIKFFSSNKYDDFINDLYDEDIIDENEIDIIQNNKDNDKNDDLKDKYKFLFINDIEKK